MFASNVVWVYCLEELTKDLGDLTSVNLVNDEYMRGSRIKKCFLAETFEGSVPTLESQCTALFYGSEAFNEISIII